MSQSPEPDLGPRRIKRRVAVESEDDEDSMQDVGMEEQRPQLKRARRSYTSSHADEMDVEVEFNDEDLPKTKGGKKKRTAAVFTSDEDEEFVDDEPATPILDHLELSDGDYEAPSLARSKPSRQRTMSWKAKEAGGGAVSKGKQPAKGKGKAKKETKEPEIRMKDERNRTDTPPVPKARSHPKSEPKDEDVDMDLRVDVVNDSPSTHKKEAPSSPLKNEDPMQSLMTPPESTTPVSAPIKKKLPPIRKNKLPAESTPTASATSTSTPVHKQSQSQPPKPPLEKDKGVPRPGSKPGTSTLPSKPKLTAAGQPEINLSDKGVWDSMFKGTGASTPRSGLTRREKEEERRKELHKMRDEARAKRNEDLKHTFDLQSAWDKISHFEEGLKAKRSSVIYPNIFAAKSREEFERERRRKERERANEGGGGTPA